MRKYTLEDCGCYADGVHGHLHIRRRLAELLEGLPESGHESEDIPGIVDSLSRPMPDDAWEEHAAIDSLNAYHCTPSVWFTMDCGDLVLTDV